MAELKLYDPKNLSFIVAGRVMDGFAPGTFLSIERTNDAFTKIVGADGQMERSKSNDKSGTYTGTFMQTSEANLFLSGLFATDEISGVSTFPVLVRDTNGNSLYASAQSWIRKLPVADYAQEGQPRVWIIDCAELDVIEGGN